MMKLDYLKLKKLLSKKKRCVADVVIVAGLSLGVKRKTARERKEDRRLWGWVFIPERQARARSTELGEWERTA